MAFHGLHNRYDDDGRWVSFRHYACSEEGQPGYVSPLEKLRRAREEIDQGMRRIEKSFAQLRRAVERQDRTEVPDEPSDNGLYRVVKKD